MTGAGVVFDRLHRFPAFTEEEGLLLECLGSVCSQRIARRAAQYDRSGAFPWENVGELNGIGMNAVFIPKAYGGVGFSYAGYLECVRRLSMACASTALIWATNAHAAWPIVESGSEAQKEEFLRIIAEGGLGAIAITESGGGSSAAGIRTTFEEDGGKVRINGEKAFITNGDVADVTILFGKWVGLGTDAAALTAVIVPKGTRGLTVGRKEDKAGHRASSTVALSFVECCVPRENVLGAPGDGMRILRSALNRSRPSVAAHAIGIAQAALADAVAQARVRTIGKQRVGDFQAIRILLAERAADVALCESWLWYVASLIDGGSQDYAVEAAMLKARAGDVAMRVATDAVQVFGGYGYTREYRVERLMREAKLTQIGEGAAQVLYDFVGRKVVGG